MTKEQFEQAEAVRKNIESIQKVKLHICKFPPEMLRIYIGYGSDEQMMISDTIGYSGVVTIREAILNYMDADERRLEEKFSKL